MGGDIYNPSFVKPKEIYQLETFKVLRNLGELNFSNRIPDFFKRYKLTQRFFRRIDFLSPMLKNEMEIVKRNKNINANYVFIPL